MSTLEGWYLDLEADDLYLRSSKIWYIRLKTFDGSRTLALKPFETPLEEFQEEFMQWVESFPDDTYVAFHNGLGYDLWAMWKLLGVVPRVGKEGRDWLGDKPVQFIDTYVLSMYLDPNSLKHSLEYLASGSEDEKMDFRKRLIAEGIISHTDPRGAEFKQWHPTMAEYCDDDVSAGIGVLKRLWKRAEERYKGKWLHQSFRQMQKDFWLYTAQAYTGVLFNTEKAQALLKVVEGAMQALKEEVDPELPPRPLKTAEESFYRIPARPFKKNGEFSATMEKWLERHSGKVVDGKIHALGFIVPLKAGEILPVKMPMEIDDNTELKNYFLENGWEPHDDFWNFQKDPLTKKPMRDEKGKYIRTTPKIQHQGNICPNLLKMEGTIPAKVVKFLSYRNRKGVVEGWLNNWRTEFDGRLSAEISGYAPTSRVKHKTVTNVPKADIKVLLGEEMRDLFTVPKGYWYGGIDAAALENRTLSHHTFKYDGGAFAKMQTEGDPHCYSEDTEILTPNGWRTFGELTSGDFVAQWEDGMISFIKPSHILWERYFGEMISFKSGSVDFIVTPNHRVPYYSYRRPGKLKVTSAVEVPINSDVRLPIGGITTEEGLELDDDEIRLIVAAQADGYLAPEGAMRFEFSKERKIERMEGILKRLNISYTQGNGHGLRLPARKFYISAGQVGRLLHYLPEKKFSSKLLRMSAEQCEVFVREIQHWDGTVTHGGDVIMDTTCSESRDIAQTITAMSGYKTSVSSYPRREGSLGTRDIHRLYISFGVKGVHAGLLAAKKESVHYNGMIGCVSVPSSFVLVKRNGKILVSGNTFNAFAFFPQLSKKFDVKTPGLKEDPQFKPWRNRAKTGAYLLAFGGGAPKLASSLGMSKSQGKAAYDNYWTMNKGLGLLKKAVEGYFDTKGQKKYIPAIDGRIVSVRGKNVLLSCLGQGTGAIAMSYAACFMDLWLGELYLDGLGRPYYLYNGKTVKRISMVHDEYSWEIEDGVQEEVVKMAEKAIERAGKALKLALPLAAEGKMSFEGSWRDTH